MARSGRPDHPESIPRADQSGPERTRAHQSAPEQTLPDEPDQDVTVNRPSTSPARRDRSRVFDAARLAVLALAVTLGIMTFGPGQGGAAAAADPSAGTTASADATTDPTTPDPSATTAGPGATADPSPTATPDPSPTSTTDPTPADTPSPTTTDAPAPTPTDTSGPAPVPSPSPGPAPGATPIPTDEPTTSAVTSEHVVLAHVAGAPSTAAYLAPDTAITGASVFETFRVRFELTNPGDAEQVLVPRLEYRTVGEAGIRPRPG